MRAHVLKPFAYAHDGHTVKTLNKGETHEIDDSVVDGLTAEGFIKEAEADRSEVEIPSNWNSLPWPKLQVIGRALGLGRNAGKADVVATIAAELAKRG